MLCAVLSTALPAKQRSNRSIARFINLMESRDTNAANCKHDIELFPQHFLLSLHPRDDFYPSSDKNFLI
jgi:hypothetical protein